MIERKRDDEFVVVSNGMLGYGFREESLLDAVEAGVDLIACDAGSSDPGPLPGHRQALCGRRHDPARFAPAGEGGCGCGRAARHRLRRRGGRRRAGRSSAHAAAPCAGGAGLGRKIAVLRSELDRETVREAMEDGRVRVFETGAPLTTEDVDAAAHIVAQVGPESYFPGARRQARHPGRRPRLGCLQHRRTAVDAGT